MEERLLMLITSIMTDGDLPRPDYMTTTIDEDVADAEKMYDLFAREIGQGDLKRQDAAETWGARLSAVYRQQGARDGICMGALLMLSILKRAGNHLDEIA